MKKLNIIVPGAAMLIALFMQSCGVNPSSGNLSNDDTSIVGTWLTQNSGTQAQYQFTSANTYTFTPYSAIGAPAIVNGTYVADATTGDLTLTPNGGGQVTYSYTVSSDNSLLTITYDGNSPTNYLHQ